MNHQAQALIDRFGMKPIPGEGGWFCETWRSAAVDPATDKPAGTAILALFCDEPGGFSALHRLPTTEIWHFCGGDAFDLLLLRPDGTSAVVMLGPDEPQVVIPPGTWMGGRVARGGRFTLVGCTMAPGFTEADFEAGRPDELVAGYPDRATEIDSLR